VAAVDPIHFAHLRKVFPSLSDVQTCYSMISSTGATHNDIAELTGKSSVTIKKTLVKAQQNIGALTPQTMRFTVLSKVLLCVFVSISIGKPLTTSLPEVFLTEKSDGYISDKIGQLFPELTYREVKICCLYSAGEDQHAITSKFNISDTYFKQKIDEIILKLDLKSVKSMQILVTNRLLMSLALLSINLSDSVFL
jgi:hypothetical protein